MAPTKILLAEDDADDQLLFREFLKHRKDIELLPIAENGVVLLETLESISNTANLPHLVILDQNMPKKNGLGTLQSLKDHHLFQQIPVVIYSTYSDEQLIRDCSAAGASAIFPKPITKEGYDAMIDQCLELARRT